MSINPRLGGTISHGGSMPAPEDPGGAGGGPPERPIALLFMVVSAVLVAAVLYRSEQHFVDDPVAQAQRGDIAGLEDGSLLLAPSFRRALGEIGERAGGATVKNLRLSPISLDTTVRDPEGRQMILRVDPAFRVSENDFGDSPDPGFPFRAVDLDAPAKITRTVARKAQAGTRDLDYMVLNRTPAFGQGGETYTWTIFLTREVPIARRQWSADGDGSDVRRLGTPPRAERRRQVRQRREAAAQQRTAKARARCFSRADDAADVQRCVARFD